MAIETPTDDTTSITSLGPQGKGSFLQRLAAWVVKLRSNPSISLEALNLKYQGRAAPQPATLKRGLRRHFDVSEELVNGCQVYTFRQRVGGSGWHIIYTHGGAFVNPLQKAHWDIVECLLRATGATVTVPIYPLAPEHTYSQAFEFLEAVYRDVLESVSPGRIVLCGDSAGGNLALTQALHFRDRGLPAPARLVLFSPWLDLALGDSRARDLEPLDDMLRVDGLRQMGSWWAGSADLAEPLLSPLNADLQGLPPIDVYQGTHDILYPDARTFHERVLAAGGSSRLHVTEAGFHVFMGATFTPEARRVFSRIASDLGVAP